MKWTGDINIIVVFGSKFAYFSFIDWHYRLPLRKLTERFYALFSILISTSITVPVLTLKETVKRLFVSIVWNYPLKDYFICLFSFYFLGKWSVEE